MHWDGKAGSSNAEEWPHLRHGWLEAEARATYYRICSAPVACGLPCRIPTKLRPTINFVTPRVTFSSNPLEQMLITKPLKPCWLTCMFHLGEPARKNRIQISDRAAAVACEHPAGEEVMLCPGGDLKSPGGRSRVQTNLGLCHIDFLGVHIGTTSTKALRVQAFRVRGLGL